ncbi:MAG: DUF262 domain-containing HNH endonuclease family protein [Snowella sp.]|nr:DUF262 domain-containing HNH endonuclease family protein [Snowella sp.]
MQADPYSISEVFRSGGDIRYVLPPFQREYSWEKQQWQTLLQDIFTIYKEYEEEFDEEDKESKLPEHFLGSLVVINDGYHNNGTYKLVDGQQRLTTISLLCCALRNIVKPNNSKLAGKCNNFLVNNQEKPEDDTYYKLLPTNKYGDREAYQAIINDQEIPNSVKSSIPSAYQYIFHEVHQKIKLERTHPNTIYKVISNCFQVVYIRLDRNESPYKIFESLNAKGKDLSQADLVRNYIAMRLPFQDQEKVFNNCWSKIETLLQEKETVGKSRIGELTAFIRHYLATHSRILCAKDHICIRFRDRCEKYFPKDSQFIAEITKLSKFAEYYNCLIRPEEEKEQEIRAYLTRLNKLEISTAYPFLLALYSAYNSQEISKKDCLHILKTLENYLVRRYIAGESTNYLSQVFPVLWNDIFKEKSNQNIKEATEKLLASKRYPSDQEIRESIKKAKLYEKNPTGREKLCFVLEEINRHLSKGSGGYTILEDKATIEHIMPQTPSHEWKRSLGEDYETVYQNYLNTLGNLTLVTSEWNSSLSNRPFEEKKQKLASHALKINKDYFSQDILYWNEIEILKRMEFITDNFLEVWPSFGQTESLNKNHKKSPRSVTIRQDTIEIPDQTWLQFRVLVVECGIKNYPNSFELIRESLPTHFCDDPTQEQSTKNWHKLSNGIWLSKSYSAKDHYRFCLRFLDILDISESEWSYQEID